MARVGTYLDFPRSTEEASLFSEGVFGTELSAPIARFGSCWMFNRSAKE